MRPQPRNARPSPRAAKHLFLLHVVLRDVTPPVWRRFVVPGSFTLRRLHETLQVVMGWENYHLYEFEIGGTTYGELDPDGWTPDPLQAAKTTLDTLHLLQGHTLLYRYDFGDDWEHDLIVEGMAPHISLGVGPICLGGARACPPEDSGGAPGYMELLKALHRPRSRRGRELLEWLGGPFDPEYLDLRRMNAQLRGKRGHRS